MTENDVHEWMRVLKINILGMKRTSHAASPTYCTLRLPQSPTPASGKGFTAGLPPKNSASIITTKLTPHAPKKDSKTE